eukprot:5556153-Pleurochrysis_carterae.AAC.2
MAVPKGADETAVLAFPLEMVLESTGASMRASTSDCVHSVHACHARSLSCVASMLLTCAGHGARDARTYTPSLMFSCQRTGERPSAWPQFNHFLWLIT